MPAKSHVTVAAIGVALFANFFGSSALEDVIRFVGVAELALVDSPVSTSADEIVAQDDVHQQIRLLRHADVEDFEISALVARTREYHLDFGAETGVVTNALDCRIIWLCAQYQF